MADKQNLDEAQQVEPKQAVAVLIEAQAFIQLQNYLQTLPYNQVAPVLEALKQSSKGISQEELDTLNGK